MKITINSTQYTVPDGASISTINGTVYVNGKPYNPENTNPTIPVEVKIEGNVGPVTVDRGSVAVTGDVTGNVSAGSSVKCGNVGGYVDAGSSVTCANVSQNVEAGSSVKCGNVGGDVDAGGSVTCGNVIGAINAGGSVKTNKST